MSSDLLQVFVELCPLSPVLIPFAMTGLSIPVFLFACSEDWTCNHQMIVFLVAQGTNAYNRYAMLDNSEWILGYYKLNVLTIAKITTIM